MDEWAPALLALKDTVRYRMLKHLSERGCDSIMGLSRALGQETATIYRKISVSKRHGHITDQRVVEPNPVTHNLIIVHKVYITEKGKQWLKEQAT